MTTTPVLETLPNGFVNRWVTRKNKPGRWEIIDERSQTRYRHEPMQETAQKCALLAIAQPFYLAGYVAYHTIRTPLVGVRVLCSSFSIKDAVVSQLEGLWTIVRAPFYAIAFEFAAIYGIFRPVEGRAWLGYIQEGLHGIDGNKGRKDAWQHMEGEYTWSENLDIWTKRDIKFFAPLAFCMLPYRSGYEEITPFP